MLRVIARMDIKSPNLIKGVHLEGLRVIGDPGERARRYFEQGIDEILYMDIVASLYGRNHLTELLQLTTKDVFVPITVGGGIRTVDDARAILRAGADKVAINTAAIEDPTLITKLADVIGCQSVVVSIEAKRKGSSWEAYTDNGRGRTGRDVIEWAQQAQAKGCGEILLTSIDQEGTRRGFDIDLLRAVSSQVSVPVIGCGGFGELDHIGADFPFKDGAIAIADALHFDRYTVAEIKRGLADRHFDVRG